MMAAPNITGVESILREAAADLVLPRFRALTAGEISEKSPGEVVTVVDLETEKRLSRQLAAVLPGSLIVGEEAVSENPAILDALGAENVWLIDPLDGTANFAAGLEPFAIMVALVRRGELVASWILNPVGGALCFAERGAGAFRDGVRMYANSAQVKCADQQGAVLTRFLPPELRTHVELQAPKFRRLLPGTRCAGHEYPAIVLGEQHFTLFWRTLPWDHAPGVLLLTEAGGRVARPSGEPYRAVSNGVGLLAAANEDVWHAVRAALLPA